VEDRPVVDIIGGEKLAPALLTHASTLAGRRPNPVINRAVPG
jgi:hypothetical protein